MKEGIRLKEAIEEYKNIYLPYRNYSHRTRSEYTHDLTDLVLYLNNQGINKLLDVELTNLIHYMADLENRGFSGATRKRKVISIRSFFGFLYIEGYIATDIGKHLIPPHVELYKPRYLKKWEVDQLLLLSRVNKRDYAIIQLLLQTGIKLSEITNLTLLNLQRTISQSAGPEGVDYLVVRGGERSKAREVPLNLPSMSAIDNYIRVRKDNMSDSIFLNKSGKPLGKRGVEKLAKKYFKLAGIKNANINSLRNTFGVHQVSMGTRRSAIQKVMGYRGQRTVEKYFMQDEG